MRLSKWYNLSIGITAKNGYARNKALEDFDV